jgi:lysophospholipase L1-like esterase
MVPPVAANLQLLYPSRVVHDGGVAGQTSSEIAARQQAAAGSHDTWINIFWYGHNNQTQSSQIKADIAASVATLAPGNTRFLVLAVVNQATAAESRGGSDYPSIIQLNNDLAALYPQNYLDIRVHLVNGYDPANAQDVADFQNDVVPSSLRFDHIHLNNQGSVRVAQKLREVVDAKGW